MKICFVCTGNTCRSPMAEAILRAKAVEGIEVRSAGIYAMSGTNISNNAKQVLFDTGIEFSHSSRQFGEHDVEWANIVLTMTNAHKQAILDHYPESISKTYTLIEYVRQNEWEDVADPFGGDIQVYKKTWQQLHDLINELLQKLQGEYK